MPYESIPGVGATYIDGAFKTVVTSDQPRILVLGTSESGISYNIFQINSVNDAEDEFGSSSELMKPVHEALEQGSDNVAVMRIGGKKGKVILTDDDGGSLTIEPDLRDNEALDRYSLFIELIDTDSPTDGVRVSIFDQEKEEWVYDSENIRVLDTGLIDVVEDGFDLLLTEGATKSADVSDPTSAPVLADYATEAITDMLDAHASADTAVVDVDVEVTAGDDGATMTAMEKYAALTHGYQFLDYQDGDILIPAGDVYVDCPNQAGGVSSAGVLEDDDKVMDFSSFNAGEPGLPDPGATDDGLAFLWQMEYRGKPYTVFFENQKPWDTDGADFEVIHSMVSGDNLTLTPNEDIGDLASVVKLRLTAGGTAGSETVDVFVEDGAIVIDVEVEAGGTNHGQLKTALDDSKAAALFLDTVAVEAAGAALAGADCGDAASIWCDGGTGSSPTARVILDDLLSGDDMPAPVLKRLSLGENAEVRECHFGHQLATAAAKASTTWSTMMGIISASEPDAYSRPKVAEWVGDEPDYTVVGTDLAVDSTGDDGEGLLGIKFHAGKAGYRSKQIKTGSDGNEGYAYGGYILTEGASLPTDYPYGISDGDEATDAKAKPVDIGRHLLVCASWPVLSNSFNGGSEYRGTLCGTLAGKLTVTPEKEEPIGINGVLSGIRRPPRMRTPLINSLAKLRFVSTRREEGLGHILVSVKTAAHPDSDYSRLSTIRSVNREISGIRNICKPYIGKEFSSTRLASLQTSINGFLKAEKELGYNQGAVCSLSYTRQDKIMGRLTVKLKMIPPFSIEAITIETTLAADESELT